MAIGREDIQRVREATDITAVFSEHVPLRQRGREFWCCCPFHEEKTPSCKVDPNTQLFYCFGCHKGGDVFKFVQEIEGIEFPDAVRRLADRANIELSESATSGPSRGERARLMDACAEAADFFHLQLMRGRGSGADAARAYLSARGFGSDVAKRWKLGYAPGRGQLVAHLRSRGFTAKEAIDCNVATSRSGPPVDRFFDRVMFPIFSESGECIAFGGRVIGDGEPKYLNSTETPVFSKRRTLFGMDRAKAGITSSGVAIVVEGYTDVIACHEAGVTNVVATLGTALSREHIRAISRHASKRIVYLFDGDAAGQRAADRALEFIGESMTEAAGRRRIDLVACVLPDNLDPADFIAQRGADAFRAQVEDAVPLVSFGIERRISAFDTSSAEGRTAAVTEALSVLAPIKDSLLAKDYAVQIAGRLHLREDDVLERLAALPVPRVRFDDEPVPDEAPAPPVAPVTPVRITETEESRRSFEANLLAACVRRPALALKHAEELAAVNWHVPLHADVAGLLLDELATDPTATPAHIATTVTSAHPASAGLLATDVAAGTDADAAIAYALEELAIGDLEAAVDAYRAQLSSGSDIEADEADLLFQTVSSLQQTLAARKVTHARQSLQ